MAKRSRILIIVLAALLISAGVALAGCASEPEAPPAEQEQTAPEPAEEPEAEPAEPESTDSGASGSLDGEELVAQKCSMCHTLDRVNQASKSAEEWSATVERMVGHGLVVTDEEKTVIVDYLAQRDGM